MPLLRSVLLAAMVGFGTGMYDGFFGPGAGTFMTLLFNSVLGLGIIKACGTTKVVNLASNVGSADHLRDERQCSGRHRHQVHHLCHPGQLGRLGGWR